jgi:hypothetical protein
MMSFDKLDWQVEYAGIGTRKLPRNPSILLMKFACCMAFAGYKVNSGAADGCDTSFETGAKIAYDAMAAMDSRLTPGHYGKVMNIFLPWQGFNGRVGGRAEGYISTSSPQAQVITAPFHPNWAGLKQGAQKMMSRNAMQALSEALNKPVRFVMCQTPDGAFTKAMTSSKTGGTGQAIRIAEHYGVKIYNTKNEEHLSKVLEWIAYYDEKIYKMYGVSPTQLVDDFMSTFVGVNNRVEGDLIQMANKGEVDILIHGCNCFDMNSGIAKQVRETFPEAFEADRKLKKGDKSKLGSYTSATVERAGKPVHIVNSYTQYNWGREEDVLYVDYEKMRKSLEKIAEDFPTGKIGIPRIGSGLGNGCWVTLSNIINVAFKGRDLVLVDLPPGYEPKIEKTKGRTVDEGGQLGMFG